MRHSESPCYFLQIKFAKLTIIQQQSEDMANKFRDIQRMTPYILNMINEFVYNGEVSLSSALQRTST